MSRINIDKLIAELQKLSYDEGNVPISKIDITKKGILIEYNFKLNSNRIEKTVRVIPSKHIKPPIN